MFEHEVFDKYSFENIPLNRDLFMMDEVYIKEYEDEILSILEGENPDPTGYISYIAARKIKDNSLELSWYPNSVTRFHEVTISLPKDQFVACVGSWRLDEKPRIFVNSVWLENLHLRSYSVFGLVDAIGVKDALEKGLITREKLLEIRTKIDELSTRYPDFSFISFGDSILIKGQWSVGYFKRGQKDTYNPEQILFLIREIKRIYKYVLGMDIYAILTQGINEYYEDPLLHISDSHNHVSLNSLGIPFSQLMSIDVAARKAIKEKIHEASELYLDGNYYHSLKYKFGFEKNAGENNVYLDKLSHRCRYYYGSLDYIVGNLKL